MQKDSVVIVSIARTAIGNLLGGLKDVPATQLGSRVIEAAIERAHLKPADIQEVIMGCVLPAGLGQAPARQAALGAGIPDTVPCTTVNKVCGSAMKAVMLAANEIAAGTVNIMVAGGMESMTNAPHLLQKSRQGYRLGHNQIHDHMMLDGLEDAYDKGRSMGTFAEECAAKYQFTREKQDEFAVASFARATKAMADNHFQDEIVPISIKTKQGEQVVDKDEHPTSVKPEKIPQLSPAFMKDGTVTAGSSSSIADGAAALVLMLESEAKKRGITPIAKIIGQASSAKKPSEFTTAPVDAIRKLLDKINWQAKEVDLFEVNEAFAVVAMAVMHDLQIPHEKMNIHGGACALGHPIGASGARIIVTLINALKQHHLKRGVASLCIGGGEATAMAVEIY